MDEIQVKKTKRFVLGIILIIVSIVYGWVGLFVCNALAVKYGSLWAVAGLIIYGMSWVTYGLGFILAGREGIIFAKRLFRKVFKCGK